MDPALVARVLAKLGIEGIDPVMLSEVMDLAQTLGGSIEAEPSDYLPKVDEESFYLPKVSKDFYYNRDAFKRLHSIDHQGLRSLVVPNLRRLRR